MKRVSASVEWTYQATVARLLPSGDRLWPVRGGRVLLDVTASHTQAMRVMRIYEPGRYRLLRRYLRPGDVFLDVGGHRGDFTVWAARRAGKVVCYEALPDNVRRIRQVIEANDLDNAQVRHGAATAHGGRVHLNVSPKSGTNTLVTPTTFDPVGRIEVPAVRLDDQMDRADVIKMDIEGAEVDALSGARRLLRGARLVVVDVHAFAGVDPDQVRSRLVDAGLYVTGTHRMVGRRIGP